MWPAKAKKCLLRWPNRAMAIHLGSINTLFRITVPAGVMRQAADHDLCNIQRLSRCRAVAMAEQLARSSAWSALAEQQRGTISTPVRWNRGAAAMGIAELLV